MNLTTLLDSNVVKIVRGDCLIDELENEDHAGPLEIEFSNGGALQFRLGDDAVIVILNLLGRESPRLIGELSEYQPIEVALGGCMANGVIKITGVNPIEWDGLVVGYRLDFGSSNFICYYNAGDYAKIYRNEMPRSLGGGHELIFRGRMLSP
ncbi:hypothetical protein RF679_12865 [Undibacterium cyanobacteriorum]|uniref:Uncharacterized protein n=1 Tax=Undibacterium cyanobacteriorum TaxID=3073561 RepID=A0ABY9RE78_9BURK|nr:hypothetical protein [Undibacterium sp. 20NA77.5]WMW79537.1 hypothetical protein RF679_12865 [Undibacterium sp. 20NA77.5]